MYTVMSFLTVGAIIVNGLLVVVTMLLYYFLLLCYGIRFCE